jgi:putative MATE family efflux protein
MWLALAIGVVLAVAGAVFAVPVVEALGAEGAVKTQALIFLRVSLPGVPALVVTLAGVGYLRGLQDTKTPLLVAVGTNIVNLVLELVLIYALGYGIGASALATVVAQWLGALVYVGGVVRAVRDLGVDVRPDLSALRGLGRAARHLVVRTGALRAALLLATAVAARIGTDDVAAYQVAFEIWNGLALGLDALAIAGQSMVARALGAGLADQARAIGRRLLELGALEGLVFGLAVLALRPWLPQVFSDDPDVIALAGFLLWFVAALQPVAGLVFVLDGILIGAGDLRFLAGAMVGALLVFAAGAGLVLAVDLGVGWLWAAMTLFTLSRLVPLGLRFVGGRWAVTGARRGA